MEARQPVYYSSEYLRSRGKCIVNHNSCIVCVPRQSFHVPGGMTALRYCDIIFYCSANSWILSAWVCSHKWSMHSRPQPIHLCNLYVPCMYTPERLASLRHPCLCLCCFHENLIKNFYMAVKWRRMFPPFPAMNNFRLLLPEVMQPLKICSRPFPMVYNSYVA